MTQTTSTPQPIARAKASVAVEWEPENAIREATRGTSVDANIAVAISRWETGHFESELCTQYNNYGGMCGENGWMSFSSAQEGVEAFVRMLDEYYFKEGYNTLEEIQSKYCPVDGDLWLEGVTDVYYEFCR